MIWVSLDLGENGPDFEWQGPVIKNELEKVQFLRNPDFKWLDFVSQMYLEKKTPLKLLDILHPLFR